MNAEIRLYLAAIGRRGGLKSRRALSSKQSHSMLKVREARRAFDRYRSRCFWSFDPLYKVTKEDLEWVAEQLRKHGDREAFAIARKLCP